MVVSKIDKSIVYTERRAISDDDKGYMSCLYEIELFDNDVVICLGKEKHQYSSTKGVTYYPIYLVADNKIKLQIGVYEMQSNSVISHIDDEGDLSIEDLDPVIYSFVTKDLLKHSGSSPLYYTKPKDLIKPVKKEDNREKKEDEEEEEDPDNVTYVDKSAISLTAADTKDLSNVFELDTQRSMPELLPRETEQDAKDLKKAFVQNPNKPWIQRFAENAMFDLVKNERASLECAVRDAYASIGHKTQADILRKTIARSMTEDVYNNLLDKYLLLKEEIANYDKDMREIKKSIALYKTRIEKSVQKDEQQQIIEQASALRDKYKELAAYKKMADKDFSTVSFISSIKSFDQFVKHVENQGMPDPLEAISILEEELGCKVLLFNKTAYDQGDMLSVLHCGKNNALMSRPKYYILLSYDNNDFELISYKSKRIFMFDELPYIVKTMIVNKCLERNCGNLCNNTDVRKFQRSIGVAPTTDDDEDDTDTNDGEDVFIYHANSMKGALVGDKLRPTHVVKYRILENVPGWRRILDDTSITPFKLDGKRWQSVEHYKQASKFKKQNPDFYKTFSLDAETDVSKDVKKARQAGGKTGKLRPKNIQIDADYYGVGGMGRAADERFAALVAKFNHNEDARRILLATGSSQLRHYEKGQPLKPDTLLMQARDAVK